MNGLPKLPRIKKQKEAVFGVQFRKWLKDNPMISCSFELKQTATNSIPFSCFKDEQIAFSENIRSKKGILIRVQGMNGEPDYVYLKDAPAFIVIKYPHKFFIISTRTFLLEKKRSKRKSLTAKRADELSTITVDKRAYK